MVLEFEIKGQTLICMTSTAIVSDSEEYLKCKVLIPELWIGGIITAYFKNSSKTKGELVEVDEEGMCEVPNVYIKAPGFYITYTVKKNELFIPTTEARVGVIKSGLPQELLPTPVEEENQFSKFQQMYEEVMGATVEGVAGKSAYEVAVENGYTGTVEEWLDSLEGEPGSPGHSPVKGIDYFDGVKGEPGEKGDPGLSAYQIWLGLGNTGTEQEFIEILKGAQGILDNTSSGTVSKELVRNTAIKISTALTSLTLTYPTTYYWYDVFTIIFKTSALTLPSGVVWHDGTAPTIDSGKWYELSIRDGRAVLSGGVA